jgi:hypothetical protein
MAMSDGSRARDEAERLVATALAAAQLAAKGLGSARNSAQTLQALSGLADRFLGTPGSDARSAPGRSGYTFANGSPECCVCPVCRMIAALREPNPEFTDRLASGASDLAAGIAGVMRAFAATRPPADGMAWTDDDLDGEVDPSAPDPWRSATRTADRSPARPVESGPQGNDPPGRAQPAPPVKAMAKKAVVKKAVAKKAVAKKAVASKAVASEAVAKKAVATTAAAKKAVATKAGATKAGATKASATKASAKKASVKKASTKKAASPRAAGQDR